MKPRIHLMSIMPQGMISSFAYADAIRHIFYKLKDLGVAVTMSMNSIDADADANLVVGANSAAGLLQDNRCTLLNLEQLGPGGFDRNGRYTEFLRHMPVVDYTHDNVQFYREKDENVFVLPFFYGKHLRGEVVPFPERPIDVLFFGTLNERRSEAIAKIQALGVQVFVPDRPVYGPERDKLVANSKAVFNWGYYEANRFEQVRASVCLSLGTPFISERRAAPAEYQDAVFWVDEENVAEFFAQTFKTPEFYRKAEDKLRAFEQIEDRSHFEGLVDFMVSRYSAPKGEVLGLEAIGRRHGTDKVEHRYLGHYEEALGHLRDRAIKVLEVGVFHGQSILMWREYFPKAEIHGVDIDFSASGKVLAGTPGVHLHRVNCDVEEEIAEFARQHGGFDVIIDDGGHTMRQQQLALKVLWKVLSPGGLFIMEDLHTSLEEFYPGYNAERQPTTLSLLEELVYRVDSFESRFITHADVAEIMSQTDLAKVIWSRSAEGSRAPSITSILWKKA